jgi:hypothetical protein
VLKEKLRNLTSGDLADWTPLPMQANQLMDASTVWRGLERHLECRSERAYFPKESSKGLMCLVDDINMAASVPHEASAHEFIRQLIDHGGVYDSRHCLWKDVRGLSFLTSVSSLESTASLLSMQRHFAVLANPLLSRNELYTMYLSFVKANLQAAQVPRGPGMSVEQASHDAASQSEMLCAATVDLHYRVCSLYMDTMARAHYVFSPRDLATIFDNLCRCRTYFQMPEQAALAWAAECRDVYALRLSDSTDVSRFWDALEKTAHAFLGPSLAAVIGRDEAAPIFRSVTDASTVLLVGQPETVASSSRQKSAFVKVLDNLAIDCHAHHPTLNVHVHKGLLPQLSHLLRMLQRPSKKSHFLLIGTGSHDLAQLAGFVCQFPLVPARNLHLRSTKEFEEEFAELAMRAGTRDEKILYLVDALSCPDEMLATITDFVCAGDIVSLLTADNHVAISTLIHPKLVAEGLPVSHKTCLSVFLANAQKNLRVVLTLPAGSKSESKRYQLRHQFSPILACLDVMWCTPEQRHDSLDLRQLADVVSNSNEKTVSEVNDLNISHTTRENAKHLFANVHTAVLTARTYSENDAAYQHVFVDRALFIAFVKQATTVWLSYLKRIRSKKVQLDSGLAHAHVLEAEAEQLRAKLETEEIALNEKKKIAESLLAQIGRESWSMEQSKTLLTETTEALKGLETQLPSIQTKHTKLCDDADDKAAALRDVVKTLKNDDLNVLQGTSEEPTAVAVLSSIIILLDSPVSPERLDLSWRTGGSRVIANRAEFKGRLNKIAQINVSKESLGRAAELLESAGKNTEGMPAALHVLHKWAAGAVELHTHMHDTANPVQHEYTVTKEELDLTKVKLGEVMKKVNALQTRINSLSTSYEKSTRVKNDQEDRVTEISEQLARAENFLSAISEQQPLWRRALHELDLLKSTALARTTIAVAAQMYLGPFSSDFRSGLIEFDWCKILEERGLPTGFGGLGKQYDCNVSSLMPLVASEDDICMWDESWATDFFKLNHAAVQHPVRLPLLIDPHGLGMDAIVQMEEGNQLVRLDVAGGLCNLPHLVRQAEVALKTNKPTLFYNIGTKIPAELFDFIRAAFGEDRGDEKTVDVAFDGNFCRKSMVSDVRIYLTTRDV